MASRGMHCLLPGLNVAAWAEGPDVQYSSGWPCQCVLRSWPDHLDWPHSGWYITAVAGGLPLPPLAGRLLLRAASVTADARQQAFALSQSALQR